MSMRSAAIAFTALWTVAIVEIAIAPYTKVEESFNVQAMHDLLYTNNASDFDHLAFSGVVPRTFLGAIVVASIAQPFVRLVDSLRLMQFAATCPADGHVAHASTSPTILVDALPALFICRCVLAALTCASIAYLGHALEIYVAEWAEAVRKQPNDTAAAERSSSTEAATESETSGHDSDDEDMSSTPATSDDDEEDTEASSSGDDDVVIGADKGTTAKVPHELSLWNGRQYVGWLFAFVVAVTQPHVMFYAGRPLPNTYALILINCAVARYLLADIRSCLALVGLTMAVFRADVAAFAAALAIVLLARGEITIMRGLATGLPAVAGGVAVSVAVDSYFWGRWLWPEGEVLFFNTVQNESHKWGVSPWYWYALRLAPLGLFPVAMLALARSPWRISVPGRVAAAAAAALLYVALLSALPHKEVRFIMPCFPALTAPSVVFIATLMFPVTEENSAVSSATPALVHSPALRVALSRRPAAMLSVALLLLASAAVHGGTTVANRFTYPGGYALRDVNEMIVRDVASAQERRPMSVYIDAYAGMTGVSRFGKLRAVCAALPPFAVAYSKDPQVHNVTRLREASVKEPDVVFDYAILRDEDRDFWAEHSSDVQRLQKINHRASAGASLQAAVRYDPVPDAAYVNGISAARLANELLKMVALRDSSISVKCKSNDLSSFVYVARGVV